MNKGDGNMQFTVTVKISDKPDSNKSYSDKEEFKGLMSEFDMDDFSFEVENLVQGSYERFLKTKKKSEETDETEA